MSKTIGVIGLGSIGSRHARNLKSMGHYVTGFDPNPNIAGLGITYCNRLETVIKENDAIIIASPTHSHIEQVNYAISFDKPVFVEKPIGDFMPINECTLMQSIDKLLMVGYNLRFHSCVKQAKEWIESDMIGEPLWGNFTVGQYSSKADYLHDGVILNWSHEIDLALHLLGPARVRSCVAINKESLADIVLSHVNGSQSAIHLDYVTQPEVRQSIIVGTEATIIMDLVNRQAWLRGVTGQIWDEFEGRDSWDENYEEEMKAFIDRLDGKEAIGCTGTEGLEVLRICLDAKKRAQHDA